MPTETAVETRQREERAARSQRRRRIVSERTETTGQHCGHVACLGMSYCTLTRPDQPAPDERQAGLREAAAAARHFLGQASWEDHRDENAAALVLELLDDALAVAQVPAQPPDVAMGEAANHWRHAKWCEWERGDDSSCNCGLIHFRAALVAQVPAQEERLDVARLVANHLMRAGWLRRDDMALQEAHRIVLTIHTGLRWDLDDDQLTPEHRRALGVETKDEGASDAD